MREEQTPDTHPIRSTGGPTPGIPRNNRRGKAQEEEGQELRKVIKHKKRKAREAFGTEHVVSRTFFSVLSCCARLSTFDFHTRMRVAQDVHRSCVVPLRTQKSCHLTACFTEHFSVYLTPSHRFVPRLNRRHPSRPLTGIRSTPVPLRLKECSLAIWLNHFLTQVVSPSLASTSAVSTHRSLAPRGETASTFRMTLPSQSQPPRTSTVFISKRQPAARSMYQQVR